VIKGYKIISNGTFYKVQKFCSFFYGVFKFTKTYNDPYLNYHDAEIRIRLLKVQKKNAETARKRTKEIKERPWKVVKTFLD